MLDEVKLKRVNKVTTLASMSTPNTGKLRKLNFDPLTLFHRLCMLQCDEDELRTYLGYELTHYPLSLFDDSGMRKGTKSDLYSIFQQSKVDIKKESCHYVIDGGFLLHRVVWPSNVNFGKLVDIYYRYITRHYPAKNISVIF